MTVCDPMKSRKTILVTAFEPFGGEAINPTQRILDRLPDTLAGCAVKKLLLPVEFIRSAAMALAACDALAPDAVILLGQAGGRAAITPETTARNRMHTAVPDNAGYRPTDAPVIPDAPEALPSTLPVERIVEAIRACGVPAALSDDAGGYVCNSLFYSVLRHTGGAVPAGFIHVPFLPEQGHADRPSLPFDEVLRGIDAAVCVVAEALAGGA